MLLIRRGVQIILLKVNNSDEYLLRCIYGSWYRAYEVIA